MTFLVHGIKEKQSDDTQIALVVLHDSSPLVRKFLRTYSILLLSINEYNARPQDFGDFWANIRRGEDAITVVNKGENIESVCEYLLEVGLDVVDINSYSTPQGQARIQEILASSQSKVKERQVTEKKVVQTKRAEQKKMYEDPRLDRAKLVANWIFERMPSVIQMVQGQLNVTELKKVNKLQEDLKKLRMGNNYENIKELAHELLRWMKEVEKYFSKLHQDQEQYLIPGSLMTDVDLEREEMLLLYTQKKKLLGLDISSLDDQFLFGGRFAIFLKFFLKDIVHAFQFPGRMLYYLYHTLFLCISFLLSFAGAFFMYDLLQPTRHNIDFLRANLISFGVLGSLMWLGSFATQKKLGQMIVIFLLTAGAYRLLIKFLITNFALTL